MKYDYNNRYLFKQKELFLRFFWVFVCFVESLCQLVYIVTVKRVKEFICIFCHLSKTILFSIKNLVKGPVHGKNKLKKFILINMFN